MFTQICWMGSLLSFHSSFPFLAFEIEGIVVSLDPDSRVWTLSLDGEVSCVATYASIRGLDVPVS